MSQEISPGAAALSDSALDRLFREARSQNKWQDADVTEADIGRIYDLLKWGPTSANCSPARFVFLKTDAAKERLAQFCSSANKPKVLTAPVCVIIAEDLEFAEKLPELFPHNPTARYWFGDPAVKQETAFRNSSLQAAYLMIAARALGFDCGPMSGFDAPAVDQEFFADTTWKVNMICSIGRGDPAGLFERFPRLAFDEACKVL